MPEKLSGGMQHQLQINFAGTQDIRPVVPVPFEEIRQKAKDAMTPEDFGYRAGGDEATIDNNKAAFNKWQIVPHLIGEEANRNIAIELFGKNYPHFF